MSAFVGAARLACILYASRFWCRIQRSSLHERRDDSIMGNFTGAILRRRTDLSDFLANIKGSRAPLEKSCYKLVIPSRRSSTPFLLRKSKKSPRGFPYQTLELKPLWLIIISTLSWVSLIAKRLCPTLPKRCSTGASTGPSLFSVSSILEHLMLSRGIFWLTYFLNQVFLVQAEVLMKV